MAARPDDLAARQDELLRRCATEREELLRQVRVVGAKAAAVDRGLALARELAMVPLTAAITFGVGRLLDRRPFSLLYGALAMAVPAVLSRRQARRSP